MQELDSDAQLRLVVRQPVQDMRHRLRRLTALPMRKLALVRDCTTRVCWMCSRPCLACTRV